MTGAMDGRMTEGLLRNNTTTPPFTPTYLAHATNLAPAGGESVEAEEVLGGQGGGAHHLAHLLVGGVRGGRKVCKMGR